MNWSRYKTLDFRNDERFEHFNYYSEQIWYNSAQSWSTQFVWQLCAIQWIKMANALIYYRTMWERSKLLHSTTAVFTINKLNHTNAYSHRLVCNSMKAICIIISYCSNWLHFSYFGCADPLDIRLLYTSFPNNQIQTNTNKDKHTSNALYCILTNAQA